MRVLQGVVEQAAANETGPNVGDRVVGVRVDTGAWAEVIAAPTRALAVLPASVTFEQAATLPIAGLTALVAIDRRGSLLGRKVLVTGASGGVGHFAVQLAHRAGAQVVAQVRNPAHVDEARADGADEVVVAMDTKGATAYGRYDLIIEGVGGATLSSAIGLLAPDGLLVNYAQTAGTEATFNCAKFYATGGARIYGLIIFHELEREPASLGLSRLLALIREGTLKPPISVEADWTEIDSVAKGLIDRKFTGKAVLRVG